MLRRRHVEEESMMVGLNREVLSSSKWIRQ